MGWCAAAAWSLVGWVLPGCTLEFLCVFQRTLLRVALTSLRRCVRVRPELLVLAVASGQSVLGSTAKPMLATSRLTRETVLLSSSSFACTSWA